MIKFYKSNEPYGFLNNFEPAPMFVFGRLWRDVETCYQAMKTYSKVEYDYIVASTSPRDARNKGQQITMRDDWDKVKLFYMKEAVLAKFSQNPSLRDQLVDTLEEEIAEDSPTDSFWGLGPNGDGQNHMGKILMEVRKELGGYGNPNDLIIKSTSIIKNGMKETTLELSEHAKNQLKIKNFPGAKKTVWQKLKAALKKV